MKVILSLSGGLDSTVLLYHLLSEGHEVKCLTVSYGQRHHKEIKAAAAVVESTKDWTRGTDWEVADISHLKFLFAGSSQTSDDIAVPEGHYTDESMKATVVPNRNMVLLSLATAWAVATKSDAVAYAAHTGDHAIYPDCRPEFTSAMGLAMRLCDFKPVRLLRTFIDRSKADIVALGHRLKVPFELTWSCYNGRDRHCGKCGTCVERREAFEVACVRDPTLYEE